VKQTDILFSPDLTEDYRPTKKDRLLKAKFWTIVSEDPFLDRATVMTRAGAENLLGTTLTSWSKSFEEWFFNKQEYRYRQEYLFELALDAAEKVLLNDDPKCQGARVQLIRHISELAGKVPHKQATIQVTNNTAIAGRIDNMSREELERYLHSETISLPVTIDKKEET
jgi:hypothetical protein